MKSIYKLMFVVFIVLLIFACAEPLSDGDGGSSSKSNGDSDDSSKVAVNNDTGTSTETGTDTSTEETDTSTETNTSTQTDTGTGTVTGTVNDNAEVTIIQSDGTTQTTTTTEEDPDYIFENVPEGEATVEVTTEDGNTTTQVIEVTDDETTYVNPFGSTQEMDASLAVKVYEVEPVGWFGRSTTTDNFLLDNQLGDEFYTKEINIPKRSFDEGFPGVTDRFEWFGLIYETTIVAPKTGTYTFKITCDDGAYLAIDGNKIVDGDYVHATRTFTGTVDLTEGEEYNFLLKYFQGPMYEIALVLETQIPGENIKLFNMEDFE